MWIESFRSLDKFQVRGKINLGRVIAFSLSLSLFLSLSFSLFLSLSLSLSLSLFLCVCACASACVCVCPRLRLLAFPTACRVCLFVCVFVWVFVCRALVLVASARLGSWAPRPSGGLWLGLVGLARRRMFI